MGWIKAYSVSFSGVNRTDWVFLTGFFLKISKLSTQSPHSLFGVLHSVYKNNFSDAETQSVTRGGQSQQSAVNILLSNTVHLYTVSSNTVTAAEQC